MPRDQYESSSRVPECRKASLDGFKFPDSELQKRRNGDDVRARHFPLVDPSVFPKDEPSPTAVDSSESANESRRKQQMMARSAQMIRSEVEEGADASVQRKNILLQKITECTNSVIVACAKKEDKEKKGEDYSKKALVY